MTQEPYFPGENSQRSPNFAHDAAGVACELPLLLSDAGGHPTRQIARTKSTRARIDRDSNRSCVSDDDHEPSEERDAEDRNGDTDHEADALQNGASKVANDLATTAMLTTTQLLIFFFEMMDAVEQARRGIAKCVHAEYLGSSSMGVRLNDPRDFSTNDPIAELP